MFFVFVNLGELVAQLELEQEHEHFMEEEEEEEEEEFMEEDEDDEEQDEYTESSVDGSPCKKRKTSDENEDEKTVVSNQESVETKLGDCPESVGQLELIKTNSSGNDGEDHIVYKTPPFYKVQEHTKVVRESNPKKLKLFLE